jgi:cytochrome c553
MTSSENRLCAAMAGDARSVVPDKKLQVHHKQLRSQQGSDDDLNLITLCVGCHEGVHRSR